MPHSLYKVIRRWLLQTTAAQLVRKIQKTRHLPKYTVIENQSTIYTKKNIVFLCPTTDEPQGGVKVIYNQCAIINELHGQLEAYVLHPYQPNFACKWIDHGAKIKADLSFDKNINFVIIPEFWAVPHAKLLHSLGINYGIYVQGGYVMGLLGSRYGEEHDLAYSNASVILAISEDTAACIKLAYPKCESKIQRVHCSVNPDKFIANSTKENIISYMPRKLRKHSQLVTFFLNKNIPPHWRIESIDGLNEDGVAAILRKSRIFLSFGELEGLSLPPIEAALSGCHIIGYTGEAAKEYWDTEIFSEIYSGDIKAFVNAVLSKIDELDTKPAISGKEAIKKLADTYSTQVELEDMQLLSQNIIAILNTVVTAK